MAIQRRRRYTESEVDRIIRASERRPSRTGPTGHAGQRHVLLSNLELAARADRFGTDVLLACAFAGTPEAVRAVTEALNSTEGRDALQHLDETYPTGIRVRPEARPATGIRVRLDRHPRPPDRHPRRRCRAYSYSWNGSRRRPTTASTSTRRSRYCPFVAAGPPGWAATTCGTEGTGGLLLPKASRR
jgi:hypothetical protein